MSLTEQNSTERAEKAKQAQLARQTEIDDFVWLMSEKRGRRAMWRMLSESHVFLPTYVQGDSHHTAYREGERNFGLRLLTQITQHCPDRFSQMQRESGKNQNAA